MMVDWGSAIGRIYVDKGDAKQVTYAAPMQTMTYGAPAGYSAPVGGQPVYSISPERFQRIMAGEPLTNEEIAELTGQATAPVATSADATTVESAAAVVAEPVPEPSASGAAS